MSKKCSLLGNGKSALIAYVEEIQGKSSIIHTQITEHRGGGIERVLRHQC